MKKITLIMAIMLLAAPALALDWTKANQVTVAWDEGGSYAQGEVIKYRVYKVPATQDKSAATVAGLTDQRQFTVTFDSPGKFLLGVQTVLFFDDIEEEQAGISWSDDPLAVKDGVTFGVKYFSTPVKATGLRVQ
jgi:hypothetical protein